MFWVRSAGAWLVPGRLLLAGSALTEQQPSSRSSRAAEQSEIRNKKGALCN